MNQESLQRLREPFEFKNVVWKIQVTTQDKTRGMAVAYIDSRAIQNRLDEAIGAFNWRNEFVPWQGNSQICGLSIYDDERGDWVTKFDGAENTDIEPVKGGLSDSFKRASSIWGIGRYLYELSGIWVEIDTRGKNSVIKENQYSKLEAEYNRVVARMFGASQPKVPVAPSPVPQVPKKSTNDFKVQSIKPSGKASQLLELISGNGEVITAYIKTGDQAITTGSRLRNVQMEKRNSNYGEYNLITDYKAA